MKKVLIFLLVFGLIGCSSNYTEQEYEAFQDEFDSLFVIVSDKSVSRALDVLDYNKSKRSSTEVDVLINKLNKLIEEAEGRYPSGFEKDFRDRREAIENLYLLEKEITKKEFDKSTLEQRLNDVSDFYFANYDEEESTAREAVKKMFDSPSNTFTESDISSFRSEYSTYLDAKDVQYDMRNNLDKKFLLVGTAELDDYFNYGFDNESYFFCVRVKPYDGSYSDEWYIYFERTSFKKLYDDLKEGKVDVLISASIPEYYYERNQGNLALANSVNWK